MPAKPIDPRKDLFSAMAMVGLEFPSLSDKLPRVRDLRIYAAVGRFITATLEVVREDGTVEVVHKVLTEKGWRDYRPDR